MLSGASQSEWNRGPSEEHIDPDFDRGETDVDEQVQDAELVEDDSDSAQ